MPFGGDCTIPENFAAFRGRDYRAVLVVACEAIMTARASILGPSFARQGYVFLYLYRRGALVCPPGNQTCSGSIASTCSGNERQRIAWRSASRRLIAAGLVFPVDFDPPSLAESLFACFMRISVSCRGSSTGIS